MLAFKYISIHYIKYFLIILFALVLFIVGWDYMHDAKALSDSANLLIIYLVYKIFFAVSMLFPLALVFGMISTKVFLIRSNALVSFFSLGYSRVDILKPFVFVSTLMVVLFIYMHSFSSFARANEFARNISKNGEYLSPTRDLFFTYKNKYIYFSKMLPLQEKAIGVRVFSIKNNSLNEVLIAKEAYYKDGYWNIKKADIIKKPEIMDISSQGIRVDKKQNLKILKDFRPKMLDQIYEGKVNFTISNAIEALLLLSGQNVNTDSLKGVLYGIFIYPFFVPCLIVIIFFFVPLSSRSLNVSLFTFGAILSTLLVWALLFGLMSMANTNTISPEIGIVLPIFILFAIAIRQWRKHRLST